MHCKPSLQNSCHQKVSEKKSSRNIERRFGNDAEGHYYWSQKWPPIFFIFNFAQYSVPRIPSRHSYFCQMSKLCQRRATRILQNVTTAESLYNTCRAPCDKICLFNHHPSYSSAGLVSIHTLLFRIFHSTSTDYFPIRL